MRRLLVIAVIAIAALATVGLLNAGGSAARAPGTVQVTLDEYDLELDTAVVDAGPVRFHAANTGQLEHELQVLRTDTAPDALPQGLEGVFYEKAGELVLGEPHGHDADEHSEGAGGHIAPGGSRTDVVRLTPGRYVVLCNLPGHYAAGQSASLVVR